MTVDGDRIELGHSQLRSVSRVLKLDGESNSVHDCWIHAQGFRSEALRVFSGPSLSNKTRIYNNVVRIDDHSTLKLNGSVEFVHNTVLSVPQNASQDTQPLIQFSTGYIRTPLFQSNVVVNLSDGPAIQVSGQLGRFHVLMDHNCYWAPNTNGTLIFHSHQNVNQHFTSIAAWNAFSGSDGNSLAADPGFVDTKAPPPSA